jgi:hypothetical protein
MLTSVAEHAELIRHGSVDFIQPDAPRVGGITQMLKIMALADHARLRMAHGAALRDGDPPAPRGSVPARALGRALRVARAAVQRAPDDPGRPHAGAEAAGLGFSLSEQARRWTAQRCEFGRRS